MIDVITFNFAIDLMGTVLILLLLISQMVHPHHEQRETVSFLALCGSTLAMCIVDVPLSLMTDTPESTYVLLAMFMRIAKFLAGVSCTVSYWRYAACIQKLKRKKEAVILYPGIYAVVMIIAWALKNTITGIETVNLFAIIMLMVVFFFMQHNMAYFYDMQRERMTEQRIKIMMSQIQPHFLYNVLANISEMTQTDGREAREAIEKFSTFLRGNMAALSNKETVSFAQELAHTKDYLFLEQIRFGDYLNVEYDIESMDFQLPPLTLQPLVENAVKYGVGEKEEGGTVKISVHEDDDRYCILIEDDGVGFDVNETKKDGRTHVGFDATRARVDEMCFGTVEATSIQGEGTLVTISIPKK